MNKEQTIRMISIPNPTTELLKHGDRLTQLETDTKYHQQEIIYLMAMESRLSQLEKKIHHIEDREQTLLDSVDILHRRIEALMTRVFDLEHATSTK